MIFNHVNWTLCCYMELHHTSGLGECLGNMYVVCTGWMYVIRTMGLKSHYVSPFCKQRASVRFYDILLMSLNWFSLLRHWKFQFLFCYFLWTTNQIRMWYVQKPLYILAWISWYVYFVVHNSMETFVFLRKKAKFIRYSVLMGH